ncbi:recombinase family protein [Pseudonocardiaceae bacterium YIM PH 21723]|nr:recombinase family protein [Pseudonocardiaceae bacterium YIM PH 21723]
MGHKRDVSAGQDSKRRPVLDSYGRLSRVPETGELEKIETQWADNRKVVERVGATLGLELKDGLSAWRRGVRRPDWEKLLERVESGESDGVVVWHTDRLFRQPRDLEKLIELGERGVMVYSAHGARDLSDPDDRFILRIEVAHAARSSDDTSRRIKRRFSTFRESGRVAGGARMFGFPGKDRVWEPGKGQTNKDRPMVPDELVERERQAIRDATELLLTGGTVGQVVREWNAAGLRSAVGNEWVSVSVRETLKRSVLGGVIEHEGKPVGRLAGDPIVDPEVHQRLRALFASRSRGRVVGERYIGTGIVRCGECGTKLSARSMSGEFYKDGTKRRTYGCSTHRRGCGHVYADVRKVDHELFEFTVARLTDVRHAQAITRAREQVADRLGQVNREIQDCEAIQKSLSARVGRRQMTLGAFEEAMEPLSRDLARLTAELESLSDGNPEGPVKPQTVEEVTRQWNDGDVAAKRGMLITALGRDQMVIDKHEGRARRVFDAERVRHVETPNISVDGWWRR